MSAHELAARLAVLAALREQVDAAESVTRERLAAAMKAGDRVTAIVGDVGVGSATLTRPTRYAKVTREDLLTAWVAARYPDEVETRTQVRPSFLRAILADSKDAGRPCVRGELDVPGVTVSVGQPRLQHRPHADASQVVRDMWQRGELDLPAVLQELTGGES
ncbi:MAG TPA: hypothetical protein VF053_02520 [Streptosporangiales bacterium]